MSQKVDVLFLAYAYQHRLMVSHRSHFSLEPKAASFTSSRSTIGPIGHMTTKSDPSPKWLTRQSDK